MIKVVTNCYVFKFVGGDKTARLCHYCRKSKLCGMICVYGNAPDCPSEDGIFVCPKCAQKGCLESENQWKELARRVKARKPSPASKA